MERNLNALGALLIACVLFGAFAIQYLKAEQPCPLCLFQRLAMLGLAASLLMNCRFDPSKFHYGSALFFCLFGGFVALRQIALHVCPQFPSFGEPFWGLSLYTWSFVLFSTAVMVIALCLMLFDHTKNRDEPMNLLGHLAFWVVFLAAFANVFSTLALCGLKACPG